MTVPPLRLRWLLGLWLWLLGPRTVAAFPARPVGSIRSPRSHPAAVPPRTVRFSGGDGGRDDDSQKPILVVGATGRVGRRVVQKLLGQGRPVRALVRSRSKARGLFGTDDALPYPPITVIKADLGRYDDCTEALEQAVAGCGAIISVSGCTRFSQWTDFLPWRLFSGPDVSAWADRDHPYYSNYLAQKELIRLAKAYQVERFVRLTGLGLAYSAWNPVKVLFNALLSLNSRYHAMCEAELARSGIPYVVLRPGGLASEPRDTKTTNLQIDASGKLPLPGRVGRQDVADLAVEACGLPSSKSYTLACRWCGDGVKPKPQGLQTDGFASATACLQRLVASPAVALPPTRMQHYALPVGIVVYTVALVVWKLVARALRLALTLLRG